MKYYKFKKIFKGDNPIIRVTYKTFWGKLVDRDVCPSRGTSGFWVFMDNANLTHNFGPINNFYNNDLDEYIVNE